jgi:capsular exopolysaccharide synthesis family protein
MSKFFEALERAQMEQARRTEVSSARTTGRPPPPAASSGEVPLAAPPVLGAPATAPKGSVDRPDHVEEHLVSLCNPRSFEAEQYRVLRHVVETLRKNTNLGVVVAVTSPEAGDGKTTTSINLAGALAQSSQARVLLADFDFRRPKVAARLGLGGSRRSLVDVLVEPRLTLEDAVEHLPRFNLSVVPSGSAVGFYELLKSPRVEALLEEARRRYDFIILDAPPFVPVPDCRLLAEWVDGFLIVVAAHRTPRGLLAETVKLIDLAKVVGVVFNGDDTLRRGGYYKSYYNGDAESPGVARWRSPWSKS